MERKDIAYVLMSMVLFHLANAALLPHTAIKIEEVRMIICMLYHMI